ncbi:hypothetical protein EJ04DRAFT_490796 [Polyplosphaeria fusca]|uniref:VASt domain-containing protein n=1 Tax=Polyplosphaeria fusca TaxID=682080 RepID=A0A9P4QYJ5_9PLEO|nr:hypothetical protein EJ04DRAFT_490796 [Polyplosphaeria fusca]
MATEVERSRSAASTKQPSADMSLAAPNGRQLSKSGMSSAATSVASSEDMRRVSNDLQSSGDGALDKFKSRGSDDGNSETSSQRRKMSRLFKGRKGRRKSTAQDDFSSSVDTVEPVPPLPAANPLSQSEDSLPLHKSVASSLITEDSDAESPVNPTRPSISPHQSHAGYLTLSSPLIASETIDSSVTTDATLVGSAASSGGAPTPNHAKTIDVGNIKRSASPVGKLKEAFAPTRRSTSPKAGALDPEGSRPSTSGGSFGALFGTKRRGSKVLDDLVLQQSPPQIHDSEETQSAPTLAGIAPKRIITQIPATPPNLVDAPTTLVTPPTPTDAKPASPTESTTSSKGGAKHTPSQSNPNVVVSPSGNMISHRRARSATNPPSKLSSSMTAPLTPTLEEVKTPGGTAFPPQTPTGFFSSVFSAAQNAANTFSTTITNTTTGKNKPGNQQKDDETKTGELGGEEVIGPDSADTSTNNSAGEKKRPAVETLGSGNLSLAQLGISESADPSPNSSAINLTMQNDHASAKAEDIAAAQAVSAAYASDKVAPVNDRPRSLTTLSGGATSPPRQTDVLDSPAPASVQRQGSIRSRISGGRKRRHRGSSATTGNTIAAAIGSSTSTLAPNSAAVMNGQRLNGTGFAVAPPKRNRDFHNLFKSVPEDDYLIEDYSAALQKEILLQGRLYVSEGHLCFSSNILGWVTNLVISFDEVVSVEKKSTAVVFPNAIVIQTLHARNVFASFLSRDSTYDLIIGIWKISHPNLKSSLNGVALDGSGTGDKTEKAESVDSDGVSEPDSDDEVYDEDAEEEDGIGSFTEAGEGSIAGSEMDQTAVETRKASATVAQAVSGGPTKLSEGAEAAVNGSTAAQDYPGAPTHAPTDCGDADQHFDKLLIDTTIPAPLGKVYTMMFGPASGVFMRKWLLDEKNTDLQMEDDKQGLGEKNKTFTYSYTKPLPGSIGPRQTRCNISMNLEQFDLEKGVTVLCNTQTPDVPSGNIFVTKTRYCLMWGPANSTRLIMTFTVEWSGKSWLRGPIEKGANDGQLTYATSLSSALRATVSAKPTSKIPSKPGAKGKKRSKTQPADESTLVTPTTLPSQPSKTQEANWGPLDPLRTLLSPVLDLVDPKAIVILLSCLLLYTWIFRGAAPAAPHVSLSAAQRSAAYEQLWRAEEAELWNWLEERVGLDRVHGAGGAGTGTGGSSKVLFSQQESVGEGMREREVDEAIRVTEMRLEALKGKVRREREGGS